MTIEILNRGAAAVARVSADDILIQNADDALDLLGNCGYQGATGIVLSEHHLNPDFFDLKTKLAGEVLQKFSTYQMRLAIVGNHGRHNSQSLRDFIYESNKQGQILFVDTEAEALERFGIVN